MAGIWTSTTLPEAATMARIGPTMGMKPLWAFFFPSSFPFFFFLKKRKEKKRVN